MVRVVGLTCQSVILLDEFEGWAHVPSSAATVLALCITIKQFLLGQWDQFMCLYLVDALNCCNSREGPARSWKIVRVPFSFSALVSMILVLDLRSIIISIVTRILNYRIGLGSWQGLPLLSPSSLRLQLVNAFFHDVSAPASPKTNTKRVDSASLGNITSYEDR